MTPKEINQTIHEAKGYPDVGSYCMDYTSRIETAWKLLSEMRDADCDIALVSSGLNWSIETNLFDGFITDKVASIAICLAWLRWKKYL